MWWEKASVQAAVSIILEKPRPTSNNIPVVSFCWPLNPLLMYNSTTGEVSILRQVILVQQAPHNSEQVDIWKAVAAAQRKGVICCYGATSDELSIMQVRTTLCRLVLISTQPQLLQVISMLRWL